MTGSQRPSPEIDSRRLIIKAAIATLFVLALLGLGSYAFMQGIIHGRIVYLAESFGAFTGLGRDAV